eukprot:UN18883
MVFVCMLFYYFFKKTRRQKNCFAKFSSLVKSLRNDLFVSVCWKKSVIYQDSFKFTHLLQQDTVTRIDEIARLFVAAGIMVCVEQGLLKLDDDIGAYLQAFQKKSKINT